MEKVKILNAEEQGLDTVDGTKWYALCTEHQMLQPFKTAKEAELFARCNRQAEWCQFCSPNYKWNEDKGRWEVKNNG